MLARDGQRDLLARPHVDPDAAVAYLLLLVVQMHAKSRLAIADVLGPARDPDFGASRKRRPMAAFHACCDHHLRDRVDERQHLAHRDGFEQRDEMAARGPACQPRRERTRTRNPPDFRANVGARDDVTLVEERARQTVAVHGASARSASTGAAWASRCAPSLVTTLPAASAGPFTFGSTGHNTTPATSARNRNTAIIWQRAIQRRSSALNSLMTSSQLTMEPSS